MRWGLSVESGSASEVPLVIPPILPHIFSLDSWPANFYCGDDDDGDVPWLDLSVHARMSIERDEFLLRRLHCLLAAGIVFAFVVLCYTSRYRHYSTYKRVRHLAVYFFLYIECACKCFSPLPLLLGLTPRIPFHLLFPFSLSPFSAFSLLPGHVFLDHLQKMLFMSWLRERKGALFLLGILGIVFGFKVLSKPHLDQEKNTVLMREKKGKGNEETSVAYVTRRAPSPLLLRAKGRREDP